jgi:hypothetical protein
MASIGGISYDADEISKESLSKKVEDSIHVGTRGIPEK